MGFGHDLRFALRSLAKRPGFTAVAVLTLALGIGANSAIFSVVNGMLLLPLPYAEPDRLVWLQARATSGFTISISIPNYHDWEAKARVFDNIGAARIADLTMTGAEEPERVRGLQVIGDYFGTLGRTPVLGRTLTAEETRRGADRLAVLSYELWQRRFAGDEGIVGRSLTLDRQPFTVIGVMPPNLGFSKPLTNIWVPMGAYADTLPWDIRGRSPGIMGLARMREDVTIAMARDDMARVGREVSDATGWEGEPTVIPLRDIAVGDIEPALMLLFGAVGFVLLIACANIANLLLARADERQREIAVRTALGAGRGRLIQQLLVESVVLALMGGGVGLLFAYWGVGALSTLLPTTTPFVDRIALDARVLLFTLGVSVVTGFLFGLIPAIQVSKVDPHTTLKEGGRTGASGGRSRFKAVLVVAEVALALVLLIGAGLMIRSFAQVGAIDPGFRAERVISTRVALPPAEYTDFQQWYGFYGRLIERVQSLPGVISAGVNSAVPLASGSSESGAIPDNRPVEGDSMASALFQAASGDYFGTMGIPLLRGRLFDDQDIEGRTLVAVIDETMANEFWPDEDPIGRRVAFEFIGDGTPPDPVWREVVGVVGHVRHYELKSQSRVQLYVPYTQPPIWFDRRPPLALFVRTQQAPATIVSAVRAELAQLDPNLPLFETQTMDDVMSREMATDRMFSGLLMIFSAVALVLAAIGLYGIIAYTVARRTHEIGLRMALGAGRSDVLALVMRRAVALTATGIAIGLAAAFAVTRMLGSLLFEIDPHDPLTFGGIAVLLALIALAASYVPAYRATRVDPVVALRYE